MKILNGSAHDLRPIEVQKLRPTNGPLPIFFLSRHIEKNKLRAYSTDCRFTVQIHLKPLIYVYIWSRRHKNPTTFRK